MQKFVSDQVSSIFTSTFTEVGYTVEQVTSESDEAPPGYLLHDLAKRTFQSIEESRQVLDLLLKRLTKPVPNIKLKTLKAIRFVLEKGHPSIASDLKRSSLAIQDCLNFHGPPDPLKGLTPYKLVREEAELILTFLYKQQAAAPNDPTPPPSSISSSSLQYDASYLPPPSLRSLSSEGSTSSVQKIVDDRGEVRAQGYDPSLSLPYSPSSVSSYSPSPSAESTVDLTKKLFDLAGHELLRGADIVRSSVVQKAEEYGIVEKGFMSGGAGGGYVNTRAASSTFGQGGVGMGMGGAGPGTGSGGGSKYGVGYGGEPNSFSFSPSAYTPSSLSTAPPSLPSRSRLPSSTPPPSSSPAPPPSSSSSGFMTKQSFSADDDVTIEEKLIKEMTSAGGVLKPAPPRDVLLTFCDMFPDMDDRLVMRILFQKMSVTQWQVKLKCLLILEEILNLCGKDKVNSLSLSHSLSFSFSPPPLPPSLSFLEFRKFLYNLIHNYITDAHAHSHTLAHTHTRAHAPHTISHGPSAEI